MGQGDILNNRFGSYITYLILFDPLYLEATSMPS